MPRLYSLIICQRVLCLSESVLFRFMEEKIFEWYLHLRKKIENFKLDVQNTEAW